MSEEEYHWELKPIPAAIYWIYVKKYGYNYQPVPLNITFCIFYLRIAFDFFNKYPDELQCVNLTPEKEKFYETELKKYINTEEV